VLKLNKCGLFNNNHKEEVSIKITFTINSQYSKIEKNEMDGACSAYGGEGSCIQAFGGETCGKGPLGRPRRRWKDNIQINLQEVGCGILTGSSWLRIGTGGGHL
jgi:hypothetical protein